MIVDFEGKYRGLMELLSWHLAARTEENKEKTWDNLTTHFPD
jgi:hypothetical protein